MPPPYGTFGRRRFEPDNFTSRPVAAHALDDAGVLLGGCVGNTVDVWQWQGTLGQSRASS
jgi:hypothetical protein